MSLFSHIPLRRFGSRLAGLLRGRPAVARVPTPWEVIAELCGEAVRTVFDVGANFGFVARRLARSFPQAEIYCFEPVAPTFAELRSTLSSFERTRCFDFGFSDRARVETVYLQADSGWNSISKNVDRGRGTAEMRLETVDGFCREHGIPRIDLLKSDTEGHDLAVLQGAHDMLSRRRIDFVFVEVGFYRRDAGHTYFCDVLEYLQGHALQLQGLYDQEGIRYIGHESEPNFPWANALFVRDELVNAKFREPYDKWLAEVHSR